MSDFIAIQQPLKNLFSARWLQPRVLWLLLASLIVLLAACGADSGEPVFPTARPTATTSITPTITNTPTLEPSATPTPFISPTPGGPSPTSLIGATSTQLQIISPTPTAASTEPGSLSIEYFTTDSQAVRPGDSVMLYWSVRGADRAIIYRLNANGSHDRLWQVDRAGKLQVQTRSLDKDSARFTLSVGDTVSRIEQTLTIPLSCPQQSWFFAPAPVNCPADAPILSPAAQQTFEHGQMIWIGSQARIYVFFNDGKKPAWIDFPDEYKDGQPDHDPSISAPPNLSQPIRGFGLVWRGQAHIRDRLGWATGPELGFDGAYQSDNVALPNTTLYIRARDTAILQLAAGGSAWKLITPDSTHPATPAR